jgi:hypothetical protein
MDAYCRGDGDRTLTLLGQARIIDNQKGVGADKPIRWKANSFSIGLRSQIPPEMK